MGEYTIEGRVKDRITEHLGCDESELEATANFEHDLGADSLDVVELVMGIEDEFGIEIDDNDFNNDQLPTVGALVTYVEGRLKQKAA